MYEDPGWQRASRDRIEKLFGSRKAKKLRGLKDCRDLAEVARYLDGLARLDPEPLLGQVEAKCGPETAQVIRGAVSKGIEKAIERASGIRTLKEIARCLRIAGVLHCVAADKLDRCPCLDGLARDVSRVVRAEATTGDAE
ncbi:hypothetical protein [Glycomyces salinus]|uniref:hypothetical protein n=1 Tax=Glycomyces salinus TaxID=980294 RepID=UPI0018ED88CE|nr:hypothetical protein [Glycomyces salinus]